MIGLVVGAVVATVAAATTIVAVGSLSMAASIGLGAIVGAATTATLSFANSVSSGKLNLVQFSIDWVIGAFTGVISTAFGNVIGAFGKGFMTALGYMRFGKKLVNSVMGFSTFVAAFSKLTEIVGGIFFGTFLDNVVNKILGNEDSLSNRIKTIC